MRRPGRMPAVAAALVLASCAPDRPAPGADEPAIEPEQPASEQESEEEAGAEPGRSATEPGEAAAGTDGGLCGAVAAFQDAATAAMDSVWPAHVEDDAPDPEGVREHAADLRATGDAVLGLGDHLDGRFDPLLDALAGAYLGLADWYEDIDHDLDRLDDFDRLDAILGPMFEVDERLVTDLEERVEAGCPGLAPFDPTGPAAGVGPE